MNKPFSYLALSFALLSAPAFAQDAPAADPALAEAATPAEAPVPEAAPEAAAPEAPPAAPAEAAATPAPEPAASAPAAAPAAPDSRVTAVPAGKAQIVFFRPWNYLGGGLSPVIREGETPVAKVTNGRYYIHVADPGAHTFGVATEATDTLTLELDEGETYYVKQTMEMGALLWRPNMSPSDEAAFAAQPKLKVAKPPKPAKPKA